MIVTITDDVWMREQWLAAVSILKHNKDYGIINL